MRTQWAEAYTSYKSRALTRLISYLLILAIFLPSNGFTQDSKGHISIGLLIPDQSLPDIAAAAELAIEEANMEGGYKDSIFKLQVRTAEGFWGAGSKESVKLVYEDQVRAIIGSLDGRNGHLAEQVATKSHLAYIETYATEPTLSQAFVPWFMRVVPNDNQQSELIIRKIREEGGTGVVILSNGSYDCRYAVKSLTKIMAQKAGISPMLIPQDSAGTDLKVLAANIINKQADHLIIPFSAPFHGELVRMLRDRHPDLKMYGTLHFSFGVEHRKEPWKLYEGMYLLGPLTEQGNTSLASSHAAFLYDAVNLVIQAIRQVGTEREAITEYITSSTHSNGATGSIAFDKLGNRTDAARLYQILNGVPQLIK